MNKEEIIKEYKKYCEDKNNECDVSDFIYDYIKYNYNLGKISLSDIDKISEYIEEVLKNDRN
jgi:hypothetical protein